MVLMLVILQRLLGICFQCTSFPPTKMLMDIETDNSGGRKDYSTSISKQTNGHIYCSEVHSLEDLQNR